MRTLRFEDLDLLVGARERNPIFKHERGYICLVEQGEDKGFHVHAAFFFNGAEVCCDFAKARSIGELWEQITRAQGRVAAWRGMRKSKKVVASKGRENLS